MTPHAGVAGKINVSSRSFNDITAPKRSVAVAQTPPGKMFSWHAVNADFIGNDRSPPPIEFGNIDNSASIKEFTIPETGHKARFVLDAQLSEGVNVQMIVMIMTNDD